MTFSMNPLTKVILILALNSNLLIIGCIIFNCFTRHFVVVCHLFSKGVFTYACIIFWKTYITLNRVPNLTLFFIRLKYYFHSNQLGNNKLKLNDEIPFLSGWTGLFDLHSNSKVVLQQQNLLINKTF